MTLDSNVLDNAVARLNVLALACTSVEMKSAPQYPIESADPLPFVITRLKSGHIDTGDASFFYFKPGVDVYFLFSRSSLAQAFHQSDLIALEFSKRLAGDPTLGGTIATIQFPVPFDSTFVTWDKVPLVQLAFSIPIKTIETPQATP